MADQLTLIDAANAQAAQSRPSGKISIAHQVVINAMAAILTPPMLDPELRPLFLAELADALDAVRMVDAPGPVAAVVDKARALVSACAAQGTTQTAEDRLTAIHSAEFYGRAALGQFFYWRLAGASDALKNQNGGQNAPA